MDVYLDEEMLEKREELRKKQYCSLESGYYINGKIICFRKEEILDCFFMYLPDNMGIMPEGIAKIKYPSEFRPQFMLTTADLDVNMGFNLFGRQFEPAETEALCLRMEAAIKRDRPDCRFFGCNKMERIAGYWFAFRSHAMDGDLYNMMLVTPVEKYTVMVNFNCPYADYKAWGKAVVLMWETIQSVGRKGDVQR